MSVWAIVPAAGSGRRMNAAEGKQFLELAGRPLLVHTVAALTAWPGLRGVVVAAPADQVERTAGILEGAGIGGVVAVVPGGAERQDSVRLALAALGEAAPDDVVFVHDAARPFPPLQVFEQLAAAAVPDGAVVAVPCPDTLKQVAGEVAVATLERSGVWLAQTPQAFPVGLLREALEAAQRDGLRHTDEAAAVEALGRRPRVVPGDPGNFKVTTPADLELARAIAQAAAHAVGHGFDVHRLVAGRKLILGGVEVPHERGLLGHSDADVLAHAVADACLGASGLGDIGRHFPDRDPRWKDASSLALLERVAGLLAGRGWRVLRVDTTLVAERPKVAPHIGAMEANLARALGLPVGAVTVKATTTEGLGFEGREEGISAHAVALLGGPR